MPRTPEEAAEMQAEVTFRSEEEVDEEEAKTADEQRAIQRGWEHRLGQQLRKFLREFDAADEKAEVAGAFDWDWRDDYGKEVQAEFVALYRQALEVNGFNEERAGVLELAVNFALARSTTMLDPSGRMSIPATTRALVTGIIAKGIANGDSERTMKNSLRILGFPIHRAETIARTEASSAVGQAKMAAFENNGHWGKRWVTAGDDRVDAGGGSQPCITNEAMGPISLGRPFDSGHKTTPAHPRCRCVILPVHREPEA
jgi:hypothetical protein